MHISTSYQRPPAAQDMPAQIEDGRLGMERAAKKFCVAPTVTPVKYTPIFPNFTSPFHHPLAQSTLTTTIPTLQVQPSPAISAPFTSPMPSPTAHLSNLATNPYSNLMYYSSPYYSSYQYPPPAFNSASTSQIQWQSPNLPSSHSTNPSLRPPDSSPAQ